MTETMNPVTRLRIETNARRNELRSETYRRSFVREMAETLDLQPAFVESFVDALLGWVPAPQDADRSRRETREDLPVIDEGAAGTPPRR